MEGSNIKYNSNANIKNNLKFLKKKYYLKIYLKMKLLIQ